jgi:hypothetical protein
MAPDEAGGPLDFDDRPEDDARRSGPAQPREPGLIARGRPPAGRPRCRPAARPPAGASRHGWFVGVGGVLLVGLITLNAFHTEGPGSRAITTGGEAPPFAAPLAASALAAADANDVNVAIERGQGEAGNVPACSVRRPDVVNVCALYERRPVVLALFATRSNECIAQLDRLDDAARRHPCRLRRRVDSRGPRGRAADRA